MEELSLLEKFGVLFDNIFEHPLFIILLLVPAIIFLLQKKHGKKAFVFVYLLVIIFVLYIGGEVIFELFDNLMNGLFMTLYFPNFITLFVVVVLCSIIALVSFFSKKMYRINKIINITAFAIIQMLFVLTLTVIRSNNINIYADNALYTNSDVLTLMQLLIGTFTLQVIAILIINGINKVTDILDKRSTPLAEDISEQITNLEKTKTRNTLGLIKNIEIDNTKVGYINVADKSKTSKPKLKPFKFDVDKLESITLNVPDEKHDVQFEEMFGNQVSLEKPVGENEILFNRVEPVHNETLVIDNEEKTEVKDTDIKDKISEFGKKLRTSKLKKNKKQKNKGVLLPKDKSEPVNHSLEKPNLLKPMEETISTSFQKSVLDKKDAALSTLNKTGESVKKFISDIKPEKEQNVKETLPEVKEEHFTNKFINKDLEESKTKPDLLKPESTLESPIKVISEVESPKLVREMSEEKTVDLVDNLNILDIQSTLDTVIKYRLMRGVNLRVVEEDDDMAVDNLQIPDFDKMMVVLKKCKLYRKA